MFSSVPRSVLLWLQNVPKFNKDSICPGSKSQSASQGFRFQPAGTRHAQGPSRRHPLARSALELPATALASIRLLRWLRGTHCATNRPNSTETTAEEPVPLAADEGSLSVLVDEDARFSNCARKSVHGAPRPQRPRPWASGQSLQADQIFLLLCDSCETNL